MTTPSGHRPTVGQTFKTGKHGELIFESWLPEDWIARKQSPDFFVDYYVEIVQRGEPTGKQAEAEESVILSVNSQLKVPAKCWKPENRSATIKQIADFQSAAGELQGLSVQAADPGTPQLTQPTCTVCGWTHDSGFTQIIIADGGNTISLGGILPDIVRVVHRAHEKGFERLKSKDDELLRICGSYRHPCKAFDDLNHRADYKRLFDTSRRGFIALRGAIGMIRKKSESNPE